jgi:hypothetical protein
MERPNSICRINATVLGSKPDKAKASAKGKKNKMATDSADEESAEAQSEEDKIQGADDLEDSEA